MSNSRRKFLKQTSILIVATPFLGIVSCNRTESDCATTQDILGPYYRANAPERISLKPLNDPGTDLLINGIVYGVNCDTPIENALVEVWHANDKGEYDNDSDDFEYRTSIKTNDKGVYSFSSVRPGEYLNGSKYRPSHIHFKVTAPDHEDLVTQLYFEGDEYIAEDPWASDDDAADRIILLTENDDNQLEGTFDITLSPA